MQLWRRRPSNSSYSSHRPPPKVPKAKVAAGSWKRAAPTLQPLARPAAAPPPRHTFQYFLCCLTHRSRCAETGWFQGLKASALAAPPMDQPSRALAAGLYQEPGPAPGSGPPPAPPLPAGPAPSSRQQGGLAALLGRRGARSPGGVGGRLRNLVLSPSQESVAVCAGAR